MIVMLSVFLVLSLLFWYTSDRLHKERIEALERVISSLEEELDE